MRFHFFTLFHMLGCETRTKKYLLIGIIESTTLQNKEKVSLLDVTDVSGTGTFNPTIIVLSRKVNLEGSLGLWKMFLSRRNHCSIIRSFCFNDPKRIFLGMVNTKLFHTKDIPSTRCYSIPSIVKCQSKSRSYGGYNAGSHISI